MKLRESGMPEEAYWESLFDVPLILDRLEIDGRLGDVIELGCGYGTFTIPVAQRIAGRLETFDIDEAMVARTRQRVEAAGVLNTLCAVRDGLVDGFGSPSASKDACLLFNILHGEKPVQLLREAARVVHPGGGVLVIHWRCDITTPRGPNVGIRPPPEQILGWAASTGLFEDHNPIVVLPPWHYGVRLKRSCFPVSNAA